MNCLIREDSVRIVELVNPQFFHSVLCFGIIPTESKHYPKGKESIAYQEPVSRNQSLLVIMTTEGVDLHG